MSDYKIITDSNCDFTPALIEELDIQVIPMEFVMGEKVYRNYPDERDMRAKEFYSRIRSGENPLGRTIPILAMTANAFLEDMQKSKEAGMDEHLSKPVDISALEQVVKRFRVTPPRK